MLLSPAEIKPKSFESRGNRFVFLPVVDASLVYGQAWTLCCFDSLIRFQTFGRVLTVSVDNCGEMAVPLSGRASSGRIWRKVLDSHAWSLTLWQWCKHVTMSAQTWLLFRHVSVSSQTWQLFRHVTVSTQTLWLVWVCDTVITDMTIVQACDNVNTDMTIVQACDNVNTDMTVVQVCDSINTEIVTVILACDAVNTDMNIVHACVVWLSTQT